VLRFFVLRCHSERSEESQYFVFAVGSSFAFAVVFLNQLQKIGCPIHRGLIAMSGNVNLSPLLLLSLLSFFVIP
jgi:hypothetical protein